MSTPVPLPVWTPVRPLLTLFTLTMGLVVLFPATAGALEKRAFGDVVVERGETVSRVSTGFGDVKVNGVVEDDVHSGYGRIWINNKVGGDVDSGFGDVEIRAPVEGAVEAGFGDVYIDAPVGGYVAVKHGNLELGPRAMVGGKVYCPGCTIVARHPNAEIKGEIYGERMFGGSEDWARSSEGSGILGFIGWLFASLGFVAISVLLAVAMPRQLAASARRIEESPGRSLLFGVASVPAAVILSVVLAISIVGIPVLLLLAPAYLALVLFGVLVAAYFLGQRILLATGRYRGGDVLAAVIGAVLVAVVYLIPILGGLLLYALALLGTGAAILALVSRRRSLTYPSYEAYVRNQREV